MVHPVDRLLARRQRRQFGALAVRQAVESGVPASTMSMRIRRGHYRQLLPGVVADHGTPDRWELRAMAALLWAGGDAALSRGSAGRAHGWELPPRTQEHIHLVVTNRSRPAPAGVVLHRSASFDPCRDVVRRGALALTTPARTVVELAGELSVEDVRTIVQQGARSGQLDATALTDALLRLGRVAGARAVRTVLGELSPLHGACRSWLESAFVDLTHGTGLEPSAMNHPVRDVTGRRRRIDAVYIPAMLPIELDGARTHTGPLDVIDDRARRAAIDLTGDWRPFLRFTHDDVVDRGDSVLARIADALGGRGGG